MPTAVGRHSCQANQCQVNEASMLGEVTVSRSVGVPGAWSPYGGSPLTSVRRTFNPMTLDGRGGWLVSGRGARYTSRSSLGVSAI